MLHSRPVVYTNNGTGRDMYISGNSGGLRVQAVPAYYKRTYFNSLRNYPELLVNNSRRGHSHRATWEEKNDTFSRSQDHWLKPFRQE